MLLTKSKLTNILNTIYLSVHNNRIKTEPILSRGRFEQNKAINHCLLLDNKIHIR